MASRSEEEMFDSEEWLPDKALQKIVNDKRLHEIEFNKKLSDEALAERYITEAAPLAALSVVHLAHHSWDTRIRFQAATYVLDKVLGKSTVGLSAMNNAVGSPVEQMLNDIEKFAASSNN